ncbi:hypothetical protein [Arthrobacter sp. TMN-50]
MQILYLISFAMLTLTGLVLSMVVLVVRLAMGAFSPGLSAKSFRTGHLSAR